MNKEVFFKRNEILGRSGNLHSVNDGTAKGRYFVLVPPVHNANLWC